MPMGAIGKLRKGINPGTASSTAKSTPAPANLTDRPPRTGTGANNLLGRRKAPKGGGMTSAG